MYAVINVKWHQYIVSEGTQLVVDNLSTSEHETMTISEVLAVFNEDGSQVRIGTPYVEGVSVEATVGATGQGEKVHVLKFKRKTRYFRNKWFRPVQTVLTINKIIA